MRFLADENIAFPVIRFLRDKGYQVIAVVEELKGAKDKQLLSLAVKENLILLTCDKDFAKLVYLYSKPHAGVILLRLRNGSPKNMVRVLSRLLDSKIKKALPNSFVVVSESIVRVGRD